MIIFSLREGWRNFGNLGVVGLLSLASLTVTLSLIGLTSRGYLLIEDWKAGLLGRFEIEAFLSDEMDSTKALDISKNIRSLKNIEDVRYITKQAAAERFEDLFGEDIVELLDYNPLPTSLVISMTRDADPFRSWEKTSQAIAEMPGVVDVVYAGELLAKVSRFYHSTGSSVAIVIGVALIVSVLFTVLSVQSAILSRDEFIQIVTLSGGTSWMARGPFVALGGYYGLVSGITASIVMAIVGWFVGMGWDVDPAEAGLSLNMSIRWDYATLIAAGVLLGMFSAGWTASRRIKRK
ncbi:hypothetical protein HQ587_01145 [bacterium]|nr:hypothetical protein [bacterium]